MLSSLLWPLLAVNTPMMPDAAACREPLTLTQSRTCHELAHRRADVAMEEAFTRLLERLAGFDDPTGQYRRAREYLIESQAAWRRFRDKDCAAVSEYWSDGNLRSLQYSDCMKTRAEERQTHLQAFLD